MPPRNTRARPQPRGKKPAGTVTFKGETYRLDSKMGVWPMLQFARAAEAGLDAADARGLAAIHAFLQDVIDPDDWGRFQEDMIKNKISDLGELINVANQAVNALLDAQANGAKGEIVEDSQSPVPVKRG